MNFTGNFDDDKKRKAVDMLRSVTIRSGDYDDQETTACDPRRQPKIFAAEHSRELK